MKYGQDSEDRVSVSITTCSIGKIGLTCDGSSGPVIVEESETRILLPIFSELPRSPVM